MPVPQMQNIFQIAYVTNDIDRAGAVLHDQFGCGDVHVMRDLPNALTDIGLCFSGTTNYELLEPLNPSGDFYSDWVAGAEGFVMRFHHLGMLVDSKEELAKIRDSLLANGYSLPLDASMPGHLDVLYADARSSLGHYLEYIFLEEGGRQMFASVPGNFVR